MEGAKRADYGISTESIRITYYMELKRRLGAEVSVR
jgi:hypothetical protein